MAHERNAQANVRLAFAAVIGAAAAALTGAWLWIVLWWLGVGLTQAISRQVSNSYLASSKDAATAGRWQWAFAASTGVAALAFSANVWVFALYGGFFGEMFAVLSVCGGMLHIALNCYQLRRVFIAGLIGHGVNMLVVLGVAVTQIAPGEYIGLGVLLLGFVIYLAHLMSAFRHNNQSSAALRNPRDEALAQSTVIANTARAQSRFLAAVSHELRTPLNGILGCAALMRRHPLPPQVTELTDTLTGSCDALRRILDDLLDLAKVEAGQISLQPAPMRPGALLREIETIWQPTAAGRGLEFSTTMSPALMALWVEADAGRIRQVLLNLVSNAVKFTPSGSIRVHLDGAVDPDGAQLHFDVIDTGPGIPEDLRDRLFVPFAQGGGANTFEKGTGLGLSLAREIARLMAGDVVLHATSASGTTFRMTLRLPVTTAPSRTGDAPEALVALTPLRVLVVEDHEINRLVIGRFLSLFGQEASFANDGREGVEAAAAQAFDLILMDLRMPRLSGLEAIAEIRSGDGPNRVTPVAILTAEAMSEHRQLGLATGAEYYLTKPIEPSALLDVLNAVSEHRAAEPTPTEAAVAPRRLGYM
jgi:signal transduction histidine kinase/CheY-like chemotaxis protein